MPKCEKCGREFAAEAALAQHLKDKHGLEAAAYPKAEGAQPDRAVKRKKGLKRGGGHRTAYAVAAVAVAIGVGLYFVVAPSLATPPYDCIAEQNYYIHVHPYLQIIIDGQSVAIPSNVGIVQGGSCLEPIHTHDASGILHVELSQAESGRNWTLGDFFTIWKFTCQQQPEQCPVVNGSRLAASSVVFSPSEILGFKEDSSHAVKLLINGTASSEGTNLDLEAYAYCTASRANTSPCSPTAGGNPAWDCTSSGQCGTYPYKTGYEIVIQYVSTA